MKKVLIALDFHPSATKVIEAGFEIAKTMNAKVVLLHTKIQLVNYSLIYKKIGSMKLDSLDDLELAAHSFLEKVKHDIGADMIQTIVKQGDFAASILKTAKELEVDIIVMGSHSTKWLEEIVLGRITNEFLQHTTIPLIIIPTGRKSKLNTLITLESN